MINPDRRSVRERDVLAHLVARIGASAGAVVSTGAGWDSIIAEADVQLSELDPDYRVLQIKEKFGGLSFYYSPSTRDPEITAAMASVVREAEAKAARTCEISGRDDGTLGRLHGRNWLRTLSVSLYGPQGFEPLDTER